MENISENLFFTDIRFTIIFVQMWTRMDNAVHIQVEIIEIR